jgi:hypothetical protein
MYDHIKEAIDKGECLLEWDGGPDHAPPPAPLLKDKFASERRKAKVGPRRPWDCFGRGDGRDLHLTGWQSLCGPHNHGDGPATSLA